MIAKHKDLLKKSKTKLFNKVPRGFKTNNLLPCVKSKIILLYEDSQAKKLP